MSDYSVHPGATIERLIAERDAALGREAAFKETLERWIDLDKSRDARYDAIQQRLTAADERADVLEGLLRETSAMLRVGDGYGWEDRAADKIDAALKPAQEAANCKACDGKRSVCVDWDSGAWAECAECAKP